MKYTKALLKPTQRAMIKKKKQNQHLNLKNQAQYELISLESKPITPNELKTLYNIINKNLKKQHSLRMNIFSHYNWSKKPIEIRMGRGKGAISQEMGKTQIGFPLFSLITKQNNDLVLKILRQCQYKLKVRTKIIINPFLF